MGNPHRAGHRPQRDHGELGRRREARQRHSVPGQRDDRPADLQQAGDEEEDAEQGVLVEVLLHDGQVHKAGAE
jgi:hypothetical protein